MLRERPEKEKFKFGKIADSIFKLDQSGQNVNINTAFYPLRKHNARWCERTSKHAYLYKILVGLPSRQKQM